MKDELAVLLPEESATTIDGEKIVVRPFHFKKLPEMIGLLAQIGKEVYQLFQETKEQLQFNETGDIIITPDILNAIEPVFANNFTVVTKIMALYTNRDAEFYLDESNDFDYEKGILLICQIVARNYDFFMKRLAPVLKEIQTQHTTVTHRKKNSQK